MPKLPWITDEDLESAINGLRGASHDSYTEAARRRRRNVDDPFGALLLASTLAIDTREGLDTNLTFESYIRGKSNSLGYFHQKILGSVQGWVDHDAGYDLECPSEKILAEVKNKHNTMSGGNKDKVTQDLDAWVRQKGRGWTGYVVMIVPKKPLRYEQRLSTSRPVYEADGATFYHKVTGEPNAIHDLFEVLCAEVTESPEIVEYCREILAESIPPRLQ